MSQTDNPNDATLIANISGYTNRYEWDKYASQRSIQIYLEEGQSYFIEARMKEHQGYDHLEVGWKFPDGTLERPMKAMHLSPFDLNTTNSIGDDLGIVPTDNNIPSTNSTSSNSIAEIKVFPNPTIDMLKVDVSDFVGNDVNVVLSNSFGQTVFIQSYQSLDQEVLIFDLNMAGIGNGLYNISIMTDGIVITKPFIVSQSQN